MFCNYFRTLSALALMCLLSQIVVIKDASASFEFSPIIANLEPSGAKATKTFTLVNHKDTKMPVQISIVARNPDISGVEEHKETDEVSEMFRIFPAQVILNAKETRNVRISYVGSPKIKSELPFRLIAEEIPVDVNDPNKVYKKAVARVNIATKYVGSLYVTPAGVISKMEYELTKDEKNPEKMILTATNKGTAHQVLRKPVVKLFSGVTGKEMVLDSSEVKDIVNANIMPGKIRKFVLKWPQGLPDGPVKASIDVPKE